MVQGGDPTGTGKGGASIWGGKLQDEFNDNLKHSARGIVSFANAGPNTSGSQFFITYAKQPSLNNKFTVFGRVIAGMETLDAMEKAPVDASDAPIHPLVLETVTIHSNPLAL